LPDKFSVPAGADRPGVEDLTEFDDVAAQINIRTDSRVDQWLAETAGNSKGTSARRE
jgi:hypothetical protein